MSTTSYRSLAMRSSAVWPSPTWSKATPTLRKVRRGKVRCRKVSSSTCRHRGRPCPPVLVPVGKGASLRRVGGTPDRALSAAAGATARGGAGARTAGIPGATSPGGAIAGLPMGGSRGRKATRSALPASTTAMATPSPAAVVRASLRRISKVVPAPRPAERRPREPLPWRRSISWTIPRPMPVPELPWSWPAPTCVKASPRLRRSTSSAVRPAPVSCTEIRTASAAASPPSVASSSWRTVTATVPPGGVNLSALLRPLLRHCSRRRSSPRCHRSRMAPGMGSACRRIPLEAARPWNVRMAALTTLASCSGRYTSVSRPESMRS
mmetsp:Transcript_1498/g.4715  ORF Transcript_1498/g.4715 Transcript_1498/m.4715 type:complete len:323 (+) Transcript_1498:402-1370(+)